VRKIDDSVPKPVKPPPPPKPAPTPVNSVTVKALTEIAATSPEFSAILTAVANKTATPEQHAALAQYMRAASLFGPTKPAGAGSVGGIPRPGMTKPVTPVTTIPKLATVIPTPSADTTGGPKTGIPTPTVGSTSGISPPPKTSTSQSAAPIPPVPKPTLPGPALPRLISTPVTRIPPPTGTLPPIPSPSVARAPISTPITRIPLPSPSSSAPPPLAGPPSLAVLAPAAVPSVDPMQGVEIGFELSEPGERLLLPRHAILERFTSPQGGNNVLASFILTILDDTVYIPITLKLSDCPARIWDALAKYVFPQQIVAAEMERVMGSCRRFERGVLRLRIPVEEEGYTWGGLKKEVERKKYVRKKKEQTEEVKTEDKPDEKKSLVVGLKVSKV
jgi:hypothetical protein